MGSRNGQSRGLSWRTNGPGFAVNRSNGGAISADYCWNEEVLRGRGRGAMSNSQVTHRAPPWSPWRAQAGVSRRARARRQSDGALVAVKLIHTLAWFSIESCMVYLLYARNAPIDEPPSLAPWWPARA